MKKRYHTLPARQQFSLNGSASNRSLRGSLKGLGGGVSEKLAKSVPQDGNLAKSNQESIDPLAEWDKEEEYEMKLADEISENELKGFTFGCIESLANLAGTEKQSLELVLADVVAEKLTTFSKLAQESQAAKVEFKEYANWSKQFITSVQPLLKDAAGPAQEVKQLTTQVMQCAERSMCQKYRSESLAKRVEFLEGAVAAYVANSGLELGFPGSVMGSVAGAVKRALAKVA
ncbi:MAG: hypothetical protein ACSHX6_02230 [Akkermansiaceae bacterium]